MPRANNFNYSNNLCPIIAALIGTILIIITAMTLWISFIPSIPSFHITSVTVTSLNINPGAQLTATFNVAGILRNPNFALSLRFESLDLSLWFDNCTIASAPVRQLPFSTSGLIDTPVRAHFPVVRRQLPLAVFCEIEVQRRFHGLVDFGATLVVRFRFKFGILHSKVRHLRLDCYPLHVALSPNDTMKNNTGRLMAPSDCHVV